jgi:citrate lyase subunit beta/citryl-CoA lyase
MTGLNRSYLFAPANHARRVEKAFGLAADAVILDLEDAVSLPEKPAARPLAAAALRRPRRGRAYIRVNAMTTPFCHADLLAVVDRGLDGIVLPKAEGPADVRAIGWLLGQLEGERGLDAGSIELVPIVETATGLANVRATAVASARVHRLAFGAGDFLLDMGLVPTRGEAEIAHARAEVALASRAAGLEPPLDTVWFDLNDPDGCRLAAERAKSAGFQGKLCIHPEQVAIANAVFSPAAAEVAWAQRVVAAFAEAERRGLAAIQLDGQFIDYPVVRRAERVLAADGAVRAAGKEPS